MSSGSELQSLGFLPRLWLSFAAAWRILFDGRAAARVARALADGELAPGGGTLSEVGVTPARAVAPVVEAEPAADLTAALQLLAIMQREGRLIDFLNEDVAAFSDAEIGAAARVVHEGCKRGLKDYVVIQPVRREAEGDQVVLQPGFDADRVRVTGNVVGAPPFTGRLAHHGWQVVELRLPSVTQGHDPKVVAPAEVEL